MVRNQDQLCLIEMSRSEIDRIIAAIGNPRDDDIASIVDDLTELEPYAGLIIEAPESAIDHIRVVSGSRRDLPFSIAVVSNGDDSRGRLLTVERNVELVTAAVAGIKAKGLVLQAGGALCTVGRQLETMAGATPIDIDGARQLLEQAIMEAGELLEKLERIAA